MTITITAQDDNYPEDKSRQTIWNDYVLVCAGSAQMTSVNVTNVHDGTQTHVITVKGIQRPGTEHSARVCRVCGCTDDDCRQCIAETGQPCWWIAADLCSRCGGIVP